MQSAEPAGTEETACVSRHPAHTRQLPLCLVQLATQSKFILVDSEFGRLVARGPCRKDCQIKDVLSSMEGE